ncbi:hypothetical protein BH10BAC3_BH10BAC3_39850 [soil metagenome]
MSLDKKEHYFLAGGGEMGALIRAKDWTKTNLGDPANWPQSLRSMLSMVLHSKFPMFLWWGPDLVCFYNDAYRPSLGHDGKHPSILGMNAEEAWPEIWPTIHPLIDQVLAGGEATWSENQLIPIFRNGKMEDVYWTFSYSPAQDENGKVTGVLVTCSETTVQVNTLKSLRESEERFRAMADNIPNLAWMANEDGWIYWYNKKWHEYTGATAEQMEGWGWQSVHDPLELPKVLANWQASIASGQPFEMIFPIKGADGRFRQFLTRVLPVRNNEGKIHQWFGSNTDITEQKEIEEALKASQQRFRNTVKQAPVGITILRGKAFIVEMANDAYLSLVDKKETDFVGKPLFSSLPEVQESVQELLDNVLATGNPYHGIEYPIPVNRYGKQELSYFNFTYSPLRDEDGTISGVIVTVNEVTESVKRKQSVAESEKQFRNMVMQSPIPMTIFRGRDYIIEMANNTMFKDIWRRNEDELVGKKLLDAFPEMKDQKYPELLREVFDTGKVYREQESIAYIQGDDCMRKFYLDFEYAPLFEAGGQVSGIMATVNDVTKKVEARQKVEESEIFNRTVLESSPDCVKLLDLDGRISFINVNGVCTLEGDDKQDFLYKKWETLWGADNQETIINAVAQAMIGQTSQFKACAATAKGTQKWWDVVVTPVLNTHGAVISVLATSRDITEKQQHEQELIESEKKFRLLADSMPQHIWTADTEGYLNYFNQSVFDYSGLTPEQVHKDGWLQIVHPDDREQNISKWLTAVKTGKDFLIEHRFRRHDGVYRWQLSRALPQKNQAGKIQMWVGTSTDIEDQKTFTGELERQVQERTKELAYNNIELEKMNKELQSFAYISSHDLQEPLRKIQAFSSLIIEKEHENLSEAGKDKFRRMQTAAKRMQNLIADLLTYSRANISERVYEITNLGKIVEEVKEDLKEELEQKYVTIEVGDLCNVKIIPFQFQQLVNNLVSNAIKFSSDNKDPIIKIKSRIDKGSRLNNNNNLEKDRNYCHISISDNGIGFEQQYSEKIFEVFQRLHGRDQYNGTGIGLAIVKKIVENHHGVITATGELDKGAIFDIYIPAY